jgi:hypothetical protein
MESEGYLRPFEGRGEGKFHKGELSREQTWGRFYQFKGIWRQRCDAERKQIYWEVNLKYF